MRPGGIRDIEFIVQCLQLLQGRVKSYVRRQNTMVSIGCLLRAKALSKTEAQAMRQAYVYYRRVENLLQIESGRPVYAIPEEEGGRGALARLLDSKLSVFDRRLEGHLAKVRAIFEQLFSEGQDAPEHLAIVTELCLSE